MSLFDNLSGIKIEMRECNDFLNSLHLKKKRSYVVEYFISIVLFRMAYYFVY